VVAEVTACFERYEAALISNDLPTLAELFWDSSLVVRFGANENLYGYEQIYAFRAQRPSGDLARALTRTVITTYGSDFATTSAEFVRVASGDIGRQSQSWMRTESGWQIVAAHISVLSRHLDHGPGHGSSQTTVTGPPPGGPWCSAPPET
jgi:hypothetical protein